MSDFYTNPVIRDALRVIREQFPAGTNLTLVAVPLGALEPDVVISDGLAEGHAALTRFGKQSGDL